MVEESGEISSRKDIPGGGRGGNVHLSSSLSRSNLAWKRNTPQRSKEENGRVGPMLPGSRVAGSGRTRGQWPASPGGGGHPEWERSRSGSPVRESLCFLPRRGAGTPLPNLRFVVDVLIVREFVLSLCRQKYEVALRLRCVLGLSWWQM